MAVEKTPAKKEEMVESPSIRFTNSVAKAYQEKSGSLEITDQMKRLLQNYFVRLDSILKDNETKRLKTPDDKRSKVEFSWKNVNIDKLSQEAIQFAMIGLDPMQANNLHMIPYLNSTTEKFDIGFLMGYIGIELKAKRFGLDSEIPKNEIIELVYTNDAFTVNKKDRNNSVESYSFEIIDPFNRGELKGGFYYFEFEDPSKNFVKVMTLADIEKRKPKYASPEFWGGEKTTYSNNRPSGKEHIEGWKEEMAYKTIYRKAYGSITIDGQKINDSLVAALEIEKTYKEQSTGITSSNTTQEKVAAKIEHEANKQPLSFDEAVVLEEKASEKVDTSTGEMKFPETN